MDVFEEIVAAKQSNIPVVLATVIESLGSAPREEGARMLVKSDGSIIGTIGGGAIEKKIIDEAMAIMGTKTSRFIRYDLKDIGMICGGGMSIFIESIVQPPKLYVFGAGHIGSVLSRIGKLLDFDVTVIDNRPDFANKEKLPWSDNVISDDYIQAIGKLAFSENTYMVILTHRHAHDYEVLEKLIEKPYKYIGMIGSRIKVSQSFQKLREKGVSEEIISSIHSPVGIRIGANTPAEIAVSIVAEIIAVRNNKNAESGNMKLL
jgi:xanthine dehydrogenase accessory factor